VSEVNAATASYLNQLKAAIAAAGYSQAACAKALKPSVSPSHLSRVLAGQRIDTLCVDSIHTLLDTKKAPTAPTVSASIPAEQVTNPPTKDIRMLLARQSLSQDTRAHFKLRRDPFIDDVECAEDLFLYDKSRWVFEEMLATVKHGGMLAVVGESGSGKTTLRRALIDKLAREQTKAIVIEPYTIAMEHNDTAGKTLKAAAIAEAIVRSIDPKASVRRSSDARFLQVHNMLKASHTAGNKHVLIIEEAHCLPIPTLKHLKRFFELENGFKKLLSIILIGQLELRQILSEKNPEVREVVQRVSVVTLPSMNDALAPYLAFKFKRIDADLNQLITTDGIAALRDWLTDEPVKGRPISRCYPLLVGNLMNAALNRAASLGAPIINADIVKGL
jgi:type II secretory pathway predicted ATPase ExeA